MATKFVTPKGYIVGYCALAKPSTKFNPDGTYSCQMLFSGNNGAEIKGQIDEWMRESKFENKAKRLANPPYTVEGTDVTVKFKSNACFTSKATGEKTSITIRMHDAGGHPVTSAPNIGEGTVAKIAYAPYKWHTAALGAGVTLQVSAIQIIDLVEFASSSAFTKEEGTFVAPSKASPFAEPDRNSDEPADEPTDF
jgi:hypothetical protein